MSENVGGIYYNVSLDTEQAVQDGRRFQKNIGETEQSLKSLDGRLNSTASAVKSFVAGLAIAATIQKIIGETRQAEQEQAQLAAVLRSTGESAGWSAEKLNELADQLAKTSIFSGGEVTNGITRMLSYANVVGDAVPRAMQAAADMGTRLGVSMEQAAETVGRALDKPSEGMQTLRRQGFKFTEDQIALAKQLESTGKIAQAQAIVFAELEFAYGGAAKAARDTFGGALTALKNQINELMTGSDGVPEATEAINDLTRTLGSDEVKSAFGKITSWIVGLTNALATATGQVINFGKFIGETFAQAVHGSADPIDRVDEKIKGLTTDIANLDAELAKPRKFSGGSGYASEAALNAQRDGLKRERSMLEKSRADLVQAANSTPAGGTPTPAKVKPPDATGAKAREDAAKNAKRLEARKYAAQEYYEGLVADNKTALDKIDAEETKALTENQKRRAADGGNVEIYEKAKVEIQKKYAFERLQLARKTADDASTLEDKNEQARAEARILLTKSEVDRDILIRDEAIRQAEAGYRSGALTFEQAETQKTAAIEKHIEKRKALEVSQQNFAIGTLQMKAQGGDSQAAVSLAVLQAAADMAAVDLLREADIVSAQAHAERRVAIETQLQEDLLNIKAQAQQAQITGASQIAGALASIAKGSAGEQSALYKTMFAAQKAFAIASAIVNIQTAMSSAAMSLPFPANLAAMGIVAANTASIVSTIAGTNYGGARENGGPVSAGSMYRVGEKGKPELLQSGGKNYLLPGDNGKVVSNADLTASGAVEWKINIFNAPPGTTATVDESSKTVEIAVAQVADQIANNEGPVWRAMRGSTNVRSAL